MSSSLEPLPMPSTPFPPPLSAAASDPPGLTWANISHRPLHFDGDPKRWNGNCRDTWPIYARDPWRSDRGPKRWREHVVLTAQQVGVLEIIKNKFRDKDEKKGWSEMCMRKWPLNFHASGKAFKMQPVMPEGWAEKWRAREEKAREEKAREEKTREEKAKDEKAKREKAKRGKGREMEIMNKLLTMLEGEKSMVKEMERKTKEDDGSVDGGKTLVVKLSSTDKAGQNTESDGNEHAAMSKGSTPQTQTAIPSAEPSSEKGNAQITAPGVASAVQQPVKVQHNAKATATLKRKYEDWLIDDASHKQFLSEFQGKIARLKTYNDAKKSRQTPKRLADLDEKAKIDDKRIQELEHSVKERETSLRQLQGDYKDIQTKRQLMDSVCKERNTKIQLLGSEIDRLLAANANHILKSKRLAHELEAKDSTIRGVQSLLRDSLLKSDEGRSVIQKLSVQRSELTDKLNSAERRGERLKQTLYMMTTTLLDFAQDDQASAAGSGNDYDSLQSGLRQLLEQICPQDVRERV